MPVPTINFIGLKTAYEIVFLPSEDCAAFIGGRDVTVLDLHTREPRFAVHPIANPSHINFSPDGRRLVVKGTSGRTIILDAKSGRLLCDFKNQKEGEGDSALFSNCGQFVVSISWAGLFSVRNSTTAELVFSQSHSGCQLTQLSATADGGLFVYSVGHAPRSPKETTPCTVALQRWPANGGTAQELPQEWPAIWGMQVSPTGRFLAIAYGTPPDKLEIYDLSRLCTIARGDWDGHLGSSIAWSSDERMLAVIGDKKFQLIDVPELTIQTELQAEYPDFVRFSATDKYLGLGSAKKSYIVPMAHLDEFAKVKKRVAPAGEAILVAALTSGLIGAAPVASDT